MSRRKRRQKTIFDKIELAKQDMEYEFNQFIKKMKSLKQTFHHSYDVVPQDE